MRKVLLVHISPSGCCNTLVTMLNNGDFGFPYCATPAFSTPAVWCRVFQSRVVECHNARFILTPDLPSQLIGVVILFIMHCNPYDTNGMRLASLLQQGKLTSVQNLRSTNHVSNHQQFVQC